MTNTVLTEEQIDAILASPGDMRWVIATKKERYVLFARIIEQAVLQSPKIQALKKDAERLNWIEEQFGAEIGCGGRNEWWVDWSEGYVEATSMIDAIDAASTKPFLKH